MVPVSEGEEARVKNQDLDYAREEDKANLSYETGYVRHRLSMAIVTAAVSYWPEIILENESSGD